LEGPGPLSRDDEPCVLHGIPDEQLTWIEGELQQAQAHGQNVVMHLHASPWEENSQGGACYNQIGDGRDELVNLMDEYDVSLVFAGHYHKGLWSGKVYGQGPTGEFVGVDVFVDGGTAKATQSAHGWVVIDVYEDRFELHKKPLVSDYETSNTPDYYENDHEDWTRFEDILQTHPYMVHG